MTEIFKDIPGYEGKYSVSNLGRVRSQRTDTILRPETKKGKSPYQRVVLCVDYQRKHYQIHTLVLLAFVGPPPSDKHECLHKDHNPRNNALSNLSWGTRSENCKERPNAVSPTALPPEDKYYVAICLRHGISIAKLSKETGISRSTLDRTLRALR